MLKRASAVLALVALASPAMSYDIKPKTPDSTFSGKLQPDILGLSSSIDAGKAGAIFESHARELQGATPQATQQKFANTSVTFANTMKLDQPVAANQAGDSLFAAFSTPASGNFAYYISRDLGFAKDQQPTKGEMIQRVTTKYATRL